MDEERASQKGQEGTTPASGRVGPFQTGPSHEAGPGLGRLYEARHVSTGAPSLVLMPGEEVDWKPEGPLRVEVSFEPELSSVTLEVAKSSPSAEVSDLANVLVMMAAAVERVEDDPQVRAHLTSAPVGSFLSWWIRHLRSVRRSRQSIALAGLALIALGLGVRLYFALSPVCQDPSSPGIVFEPLFQTHAPSLVNSDQPGASAIAYPLPLKPFQNQAAAPCKPKLDEVEINGGCWVELGRRPPCLQEVQAEHQGKCYMPVSKDRGRPSQSVEP